MYKKAKLFKVKNESEIGLSFNQINIPINLDDIGVDLNISLLKESIDSIGDIFNTRLIVMCDEFLKNNDVNIVKNGKVSNMNKFTLSSLASELVFSAFQSCADDGKDTLKVEINTPKDVLLDFKKNNRVFIKELERLRKTKSQHESNKKLWLQEIDNKLNAILELINTKNIGATVAKIPISDVDSIELNNVKVNDENSVIQDIEWLEKIGNSFAKRGSLDF